MGDELKHFWKMNPANTTFPMMVLVANEWVQKHRDLRDVKDGWCAISCFGDFVGGESCLPDLSLRIPFQNRDIMFIRSFALEHFVRIWSGRERFTLVQFMHQVIYNK